MRATNWSDTRGSLFINKIGVTSTFARLHSNKWVGVALVIVKHDEGYQLERHTRFELVTSTLARLRSTNWASVAHQQQALLIEFGCGGRIWTDDLRVMSPTSYQAAPPRVRISLLSTMRAIKLWSDTRGSNSWPQPWQGCALPTELVSHSQRFRRSGLRIIRALFCDASPSCKKKSIFSLLMKKHTESNIFRSKTLL